MTHLTAKSAMAAAMIFTGFAFGPAALAGETAATGPKEGTVHCTVTKDGFNWNTCPSKGFPRKQPQIPGAAPGGQPNGGPNGNAPVAEEPLRFSVFGISIESGPAPFEPNSDGSNVDGGGSGGSGDGR